VKELPFITIPLASGEQYAIYKDDIVEWVNAFPGVDAFQELRKNRRWHLADALWLKVSRGIRGRKKRKGVKEKGSKRGKGVRSLHDSSTVE